MTKNPKPTSIVFNSKKELEHVQRAAKREGKSLSRFLRDIAVAKAHEVLGCAQCPSCGAPRSQQASAA